MQALPLLHRLCLSASLALFAASSPARTLDFADGVNVQAGYFNGADKGRIPIGWDLMAKFDRIGTARIEIPPEQGVRIETMQDWIRGAHKIGLGVIATCHDYRFNGSSDKEALLGAARWWRGHYAQLRKAGPFTVNLMNEWGGHSLSAEDYAAAYNEAIAIVREVYDGPIIIDVPGWGQEVYTAAAASPLIADRNIIFSIHIYASAFVEQGPRRWMQPEDLVEFAKVGRPVMIGEFGGMREGGADWMALVDQAKALGWTVIAWAWNGDGEGMNMVIPAWESDPMPKALYPSTYFAPVYARLGETPDPRFTLSVGESITLGHRPGWYTFAIHSDASWKVTTEADWLVSLAPLSGWGTQTISFSVGENPLPCRRTALVTVTCEDGRTRTFPVHQDPATPSE
jgi:hypothetical protein